MKAKYLVAKITVKGAEVLKNNSAVSNLEVEANCTGKTSVEAVILKT